MQEYQNLKVFVFLRYQQQFGSMPDLLPCNFETPQTLEHDRTPNW
jgi:hypothetical protein